ncbi:MAG: kinesin motor protein cin8 [Thelocarpon impressellum]|nr:MAG: kinesin motor protein cin8 [Thelocarpon impressellum]
MEVEAETNIRVVVRCRGRNDREVRENSGVVLSTDGVNGRSVELSMGPSALANKTYHFDKVFSPAADQNMIYDDVVKPMLDEVLAGFNCTIFAYGQTGTGKTYTMSGDMSDTLGLVSDSAGIIPRVLDSLFTKLEADGAESSVKCSFIELYNEELRDLLSVEESAKLKIYEDTSTKKGHGATMVQGMEESHIKNAVEGVKLLGEGSHKRQVAATKCNDLSSRSHTVFTVTVYIKRVTQDGEDYVSAGKLNLVDLAGSENIQRSGAENKRAAEAGLINKSLLTLGRVINALVERGSHIPYRESKLTRLLQDSLGGRTKTCIIATVSPAKSNLEETISTLDYAFRAKNIRNKPQVNQLISKKTVLREYTEEIQKLKSELIATRQRNGVYLTAEAYELLTGESESRRILSEEQGSKLEMMEISMRNKVQELFTSTNNLTALKKDHEGTRAALDTTRERLAATEIVLATTQGALAEETALKEAHRETERELSSIGRQLLTTIDAAVQDVGGLHGKAERNAGLQTQNHRAWQSADAQVSAATEEVEETVTKSCHLQSANTHRILENVAEFVSQGLERVASDEAFVTEQIQTLDRPHQRLRQTLETTAGKRKATLDEFRTFLNGVAREADRRLGGIYNKSGTIWSEVVDRLVTFHLQVHGAYEALGSEFSEVLEDLAKELRHHKSQAEDLRRQLVAASATATAASQEAASQLESLVSEEREHGLKEREELISQVAEMVQTSCVARDARWNSKLGDFRSDIRASDAALSVAQTDCQRGMERWEEKQESLVRGVVRSREEMEARVRRGCETVDKHAETVRAATEAGYEQTLETITAEKQGLTERVATAEDFVNRVDTETGYHQVAYVEGAGQLQEAAASGLAAARDKIRETGGAVRAFGADLAGARQWANEPAQALPPQVRQAMVVLRQEVAGARPAQDAPTGETPPRKRYPHPRGLPRTATGAVRTVSLKRAGSPLGDCSSDAGGVSPSKSVVFADAGATDHQEDDDQGMVGGVGGGGGGGGLRELPVNLNAPPPTLSSSQASEDDDKAALPPPVKRQRRAADGRTRRGGLRA